MRGMRVRGIRMRGWRMRAGRTSRGKVRGGKGQHYLSPTCSLGMHNSLRDSLPVKVCHLIDEREILEQHRSTWANRQSGGLAVNRMALTGCQGIRNLRTYYIIIQNCIQTFLTHTRRRSDVMSWLYASCAILGH